MTLIPRLEEKNCFMTCREDKVKQGLCDCINRMQNQALNIADVSQQRELCEGKCGMNYCDDNGCIDRKRNLVEPKDNPEHCG